MSILIVGAALEVPSVVLKTKSIKSSSILVICTSVAFTELFDSRLLLDGFISGLPLLEKLFEVCVLRLLLVEDVRESDTSILILYVLSFPLSNGFS